MKLKFAKLNPTQNMTIIVLDPAPRARQSGIAGALMADTSVGAEQVGFLEAPTLPGTRARLQMMGGEFCGNATMSLAALLAHEDGLADGAEAVYPLEISGADRLLRCRVRRDGASWVGAVDMPLPEAVSEMELLPGLRVPLVRFPGIAHALVSGDDLTAAAAESAAARACAALGADAMGVVQMEGDGARIRPYVYVRGTAGGVWERGCGSGTAAVGAWRAARARGDVALRVEQPGGAIAVRAEWSGERVRRIEISGRVKLAALGEAFIDD